MNGKARIAILASGNGTNAEKIFKYFRDHPRIEVALLLSNNPRAYVLERANKFGIRARTFNRAQFRETDEVLGWLKDAHVSHLVLAGFMWLVPNELITTYPDRIINIHPALLPKYGGKGMYGSKVHETVKVAGDLQTGITIHLVNEKYDEGRILFQASTSLNEADTPEQIANKVHQLEYDHYPNVIEKWILGKL
jgi:phosphoribosylglycinamide formyltransferase-1